MLKPEKYHKFRLPTVLDALDKLPYEIGRERLYTAEELYNAFDPEDPSSFERCYDTQVYRHFVATGVLSPEIQELWARNCHDFAIMEALHKFLEPYPPRKIVGIMGWHYLERNTDNYRTVVLIAKQLTEQGWLIVSGGGPGAMEAAHLGAYLSKRPLEDVEAALQILAAAPRYNDPKWLTTAFEVRNRFPRREDAKESLSIPTWLYGHEPPCIFASQIAKLFLNSIREDTLIKISAGGLIFMPGSAGTLSELFLATERDHYLSSEYPSPITFVDKKYWTETVPFYPLIRSMLRTRNFKNLLISMADSPADIIGIVGDFDNIYSMMQARKQKQDQSARNDASGKEEQPC